MLRCSGGSVRALDDTSRSPTWISPSEGSRKPAISRSVVVLPQPDGPSRQTSCPWSIFKETLSTTASGPNRLVRPRKSTDANRSIPRYRSCTDQRPAWYASIRTKTRWERELSWEAGTVAPDAPLPAGFHIVRDPFYKDAGRGLRPDTLAEI